MKIRCNLRVTMLFLRTSELSLLHLGPVQIPRFTQIWNSDQSKFIQTWWVCFDWSEFLVLRYSRNMDQTEINDTKEASESENAILDINEENTSGDNLNKIVGEQKLNAPLDEALRHLVFPILKLVATNAP